MRSRPLLVLAGLAIVIGAGCASSTTGGPTSTTTAIPLRPTIAFRYVETGGCEVLGHNCPTYVVWTDGKVEVHRTGVDAPAEITGHIAAETVAAWLAIASNVDLATLTTEVGPGTCNSCVDGADIVVTVERPRGRLVLDSTSLSFDPKSAVFAGLQHVMDEVRGVGSLDVIGTG
jgi:hypothetical protein